MSRCFDLGCAGCDDCIDDDEDDGLCPECHGDGRDKWNDYLLPCPACNHDPTAGVAGTQETKRKTRDVAGILHFLTPQQMAEEIVRLDAVIAGFIRARADGVTVVSGASEWAAFRVWWDDAAKRNSWPADDMDAAWLGWQAARAAGVKGLGDAQQ